MKKISCSLVFRNLSGDERKEIFAVPESGAFSLVDLLGLALADEDFASFSLEVADCLIDSED